MVVAEKTLTAVERGEANTRWRDFADLLIISRSQTFTAAELHAAMAEVAAYRGVPRAALRSHLADLPAQAQSKWAIWRRKQALADQLPTGFAEVLDEIADFVDLILDQALDEDQVWNHHRRSWI